MDAAILAYLGAAIIAAGSALFGVGTARVLWADDLKHAQRIDSLRSQTEGHLRETIKHLESQVAILRR